MDKTAVKSFCLHHSDSILSVSSTYKLGNVKIELFRPQKETDSNTMLKYAYHANFTNQTKRIYLSTEL